MELCCRVTFLRVFLKLRQCHAVVVKMVQLNCVLNTVEYLLVVLLPTVTSEDYCFRSSNHSLRHCTSNLRWDKVIPVTSKDIGKTYGEKLKRVYYIYLQFLCLNN